MAPISASTICGSPDNSDGRVDHRGDVLASRILASAPPQFAFVGLSMGGYLAFEIMRQAAHRVTRLALLDTTARPDTTEQTRRRYDQIALAQGGQLDGVVDTLFRLWVHASRREDAQLRRVVSSAGRGPLMSEPDLSLIEGSADTHRYR